MSITVVHDNSHNILLVFLTASEIYVIKVKAIMCAWSRSMFHCVAVHYSQLVNVGACTLATDRSFSL